MQILAPTPSSHVLRCAVFLVLAAMACHHAQAFTPVRGNFEQSGRVTMMRGRGERGTNPRNTRAPSVITEEQQDKQRARPVMSARDKSKDENAAGPSKSRGSNTQNEKRLEKLAQRDHDSAALDNASAAKTPQRSPPALPPQTGAASQRQGRHTRKEYVRQLCTGRYCRPGPEGKRESQQVVQPTAAEVLERKGTLDVEAFANAISADIARIASTD